MDAAILFVLALTVLCAVAGWIWLPALATKLLLSLASGLTLVAAGLVGFTALMVWRVSDLIEMPGLTAHQHERLEQIARRRVAWLLWLVVFALVGVALLQAPRLAIEVGDAIAPPRWTLAAAAAGVVVLLATLGAGVRLFFELRDFRSAMLLEDRRRREREAALKELDPSRPWDADPRLRDFGRED